MRRPHPAICRRVVTLALCAGLAACADNSGSDRSRTGFAAVPPLCQPAAAAPAFLKARNTEAILRHFESIGYDVDRVRRDGQPVPRLMFASMPGDLKDLDQIEIRKRVFLAALLPAVLHVNMEIREQRRCFERLSDRAAAGKPLDGSARVWLEHMAGRYGTEPSPAALLDRVGEIPPSLALAQAAIESGWGTSRFARQGNALFGQHVAAVAGGMVPSGVADDSPIRVAAFDTILTSVRAYAVNLNTHRAYEGFRRARAALAAKNAPVDGLSLAGKLTGYSERGEAYVRDLRAIIRQNELHALDEARFADGRIAAGYDAREREG